MRKELRLSSARYLKNLMWMAGTTGIGMLANCLYGISVARYLGPVEFGRFAVILAIGGWLVSFSQGSSSTAITILSAQGKKNKGELYLSGMILQGALGAIGLLLSVLLVYVSAHDVMLLYPTTLYAIGGLAVLLTTTPLALFRGEDRMEWNLAMAAQGVFSVLFLELAIHWHTDLVGCIGAWTIANCFVGIITIFISCKLIDSIHYSRSTMNTLLIASVGLVGMTLSQTLHWRASIIIMQQMSSAQDLGLFAGSNRLIEYMRAIPWVLLMPILPSFARSATEDTIQLNKLINKCLLYILPIGTLITVITVCYAKWIVLALLSQRFGASVPVFSVQVLALFFVFLHWVFLQGMVSINKNRQLIYCYGLGIGTQLIMCWLLARRLGASAGAWAYVAGEAMVMVTSMIAYYRMAGWRLNRTLVLCWTVCAAILGVTVWLKIA